MIVDVGWKSVTKGNKTSVNALGSASSTGNGWRIESVAGQVSRSYQVCFQDRRIINILWLHIIIDRYARQ